MVRAFRNSKVVLTASSVILFLFSLGSSCPPPIVPDALFSVPEMLGEVTGSSAEVFLQIGSEATTEYCFKLGYDSSSHAGNHAYPFETAVQTGKSEGDTLSFGIPGGLEADTQYYYSVAYAPSSSEAWTWLTERSFHTARAPGSSFRFCIISDFHYDGGASEQQTEARIRENVAADRPDFVITLGDMVPMSSQGSTTCAAAYALMGESSQENADSWYTGFAATAAEFAHSSMLVWVNGNHEGLAGYLSQCAQYQYVLNARKKFIPLLNQNEANAFFGSLLWGDMQIIWLDPLAFSTYDPLLVNDPKGYSLGDLQRKFLNTTLAGSTVRWKMVLAHSLFGGTANDACAWGKCYARGNANSVSTPGTDQIEIQSLMETYGVNAYCYGHDHVYSLSEYNTVKYFAVGSQAGNPLWADCLSAHYAPWPITRDPGHLRVDVTPEHLQVSYVKGALDGTNGQILDTQYIYPGSSGCQGNADCDDGNACNGAETCVDHSCQPGTPLTCGDGNACNGTETCDPGTGCQPGTPLTCDDGLFCTGVETCAPAAGCQPGGGDPCTPPSVCDEESDSCVG